MSEYAVLHSVSLLLVGSNIQVSRSVSNLTHDEEDVFDDVDSVDSSDPCPDDEMLTDCQQNSSKHRRTTNLSDEETTGIETVMKPPTEQETGVMILVDDVSSGPDEHRWRAHGMARRRQILEDDRRHGGTNFSLSFDCSVQRYFSVAHWALEQFHQLYQSKSESSDQQEWEELYVMGFRIIAFLTECLPQHPGLERAPSVQEQSQIELVQLRKSLQDVALKIDECVCNDTVDEGDNFLDNMIAAEMEKADAEEESSRRKARASQFQQPSTKDVRLEPWVNMEEFKKLDEPTRQRLSGSPTSETVGTTGTGSLESQEHGHASSVKEAEAKEEENYFVEDDMILRDEAFPLDEQSISDWSMASYSSQPMKLLRKSVSLDFLKTIACEPVLYETDSEAADSWANNEDDDDDTNAAQKKSRPCLPSSSGVTPTADPARIAFRSLMNKIPHDSILQRDGNAKSSTSGTSVAASTVTSGSARPRTPSPTFSDIMEERDNIPVISLDDDSLDQVVDMEIQKYLDQQLGKQNRGKPDPNPGQGSVEPKLDQQPPRGKLDRKLEKKLGGMTRVRSGLRSERKDRSKKKSVSFDESSNSSSSSYSTTGTPTSSYTSLASLRRKTGSETSAFSSYNGRKPTQTQEPQTQPTLKPKKQKQPKQQKPQNPEAFADQDDWISFDNFDAGSGYFSTESKQRRGIC